MLLLEWTSIGGGGGRCARETPEPGRPKKEELFYYGITVAITINLFRRRESDFFLPADNRHTHTHTPTQ